MDRVESIIRYDQAKENDEKRGLRIHLAEYWDKLPKTAHRKHKELENLTIEAIATGTFMTYQHMNGKFVRATVMNDLTVKQRESLMNPIKNILLDEFMIKKMMVEKNLDKHRLNMAEFFQFDVKHNIISDFKAIETLKERTHIIGLDFRNGQRFKVRTCEDLEKLFDMKEYFIFGVEL